MIFNVGYYKITQHFQLYNIQYINLFYFKLMYTIIIQFTQCHNIDNIYIFFYHHTTNCHEVHNTIV